MFYILFYTDFSENRKPIVNQVFTMGFTLNLAVRTGLKLIYLVLGVNLYFIIIQYFMKF